MHAFVQTVHAEQVAIAQTCACEDPVRCVDGAVRCGGHDTCLRRDDAEQVRLALDRAVKPALIEDIGILWVPHPKRPAFTQQLGLEVQRRVVEELRDYLPGWRNYFSLAETPGIFADLDQWTRHRLRVIHLKQWKRGKTVYRELRARGASQHVAATVAANTRRWWKNASMALHSVLTTSHFDALGLPRLSA